MTKPAKLTEEEKHQKIEKLRQLLDPSVDAKLKQGGEEGLTEATLKRWLVARKWDLQAASKSLTSHADWRVSWTPKGRTPELEVEEELKQGKTFLTGFDKVGHPLCIVLLRNHIPSTVEAAKKFITYTLDATDRLAARHPANTDGKCVGIFDMRGMALKNCDTAVLRAVFDILQNHYPERLFKLYLYDAPTIFWGMWKIVEPFIDPVTRQKVEFVYDKEAKAIWERDFDKEVLPPEFGGTASWKTPDAVWRELLQSPEQGDSSTGPASEDAHVTLKGAADGIADASDGKADVQGTAADSTAVHTATAPLIMATGSSGIVTFDSEQHGRWQG